MVMTELLGPVKKTRFALDREMCGMKMEARAQNCHEIAIQVVVAVVVVQKEE